MGFGKVSPELSGLAISINRLVSAIKGFTGSTNGKLCEKVLRVDFEGSREFCDAPL